MSLDLNGGSQVLYAPVKTVQWGGAEDGGKEWVGGYKTKWQVGVYTRLMSQRNDVPYHCTAHVSKLMQKKALLLFLPLFFLVHFISCGTVCIRRYICIQAAPLCFHFPPFSARHNKASRMDQWESA